MKILIVDDSEAILRIERYAVLSGFPGADVRIAESAGSALELLAGWVPDIVVADYHLPDMDGLQFLLAVRKLQPDLPIGYATAETSAHIVRRIQAAGAVFVLSMPFRFEDLVAAVKEALAAPVSGSNG